MVRAGAPASNDERDGGGSETRLPRSTTMPECTRVFIAIAVPEPLERELARLQAELAPAVPGCRWASALPFHLTLAFLGDVPDSDLSAICQVVAASDGLDRTV